MTKEKLFLKLGEFKGKTKNQASELRIDNIVDILQSVPESEVNKFSSIKSFEKLCNSTPSRIDDGDLLIEKMLIELRTWKNEKQKEVKETAICEMRKSRKGVIITVIFVLAIIAGIAVALGALSVIGKISSSYCDIIGVADCMFGIIFFIYELYDDKIKESEINKGDSNIIQKYLYKSGKISSSGNGSVNVTGTVNGNITVGLTAEQIQQLFN